MKVKLFTHTDLDGVSCAIVAKAILGEDNVSVTYCDYHDIDEKVATFLSSNELDHIDALFITDISVNEENALRIDQLYDDSPITIKLLDHHTSAEWLNKYDWATVSQYHGDEDAKSMPTSGTTLLYIYLWDKYYKDSDTVEQEMVDEIWNYANIVRKYDTWEWKAAGEQLPNDYNNLFWFYGRKRWEDIMLTRFNNHGHFGLIDGDKMILSILNEKVEKYIEKLKSNVMTTSVGKYKVGVVFAEDHISELGNALHEANPSLDLIAVINLKSKKVSYRTTHDTVDVANFASYFGGGGRQKTAGSELTHEVYKQIVSSVFKL